MKGHQYVSEEFPACLGRPLTELFRKNIVILGRLNAVHCFTTSFFIMRSSSMIRSHSSSVGGGSSVFRMPMT